MTTHISKALSALAEAYEHAKTQQERDEIRSRIAAQSYKEEADREGSHRRNTQKGRAHAATLSLDELVAQFDDPTKIAALSDGGRGAKAITDSLSAALLDARRMLGKADFDFVKAVQRGDGWRELGMPKSTFNKKLKKVCFRVSHPPEKPSLKT